MKLKGQDLRCAERTGLRDLTVMSAYLVWAGRVQLADPTAMAT
jgi:hypothetical protein